MARCRRAGREYALGALRVVPELAEVDHHTGLVADHLGVVAWRDRDDVAGADLTLGAVVHPHAHPARDHIAEVRHLARVRARDRLDVLGPPPARLERPPSNGLPGN